ncbi:MAG: M3 family oligoendopeptidase [Chloroflexota bacterium]
MPMVTAVPDHTEFIHWSWGDFRPRFAALEALPLGEGSLDSFLKEWSDLQAIAQEIGYRLYVATAQNVEDTESEQAFHVFLDEVQPEIQRAEQRLNLKLLGSGLRPHGFDAVLKTMRGETDLFRDANVPLLAEDRKIEERFNKIAGSQLVEWEGKQIPIAQLRPVLENIDRGVRERAWRAALRRQLADREALNQLWADAFRLRVKIAANAGKQDYRAYRWQQLLRFDYTPEDCLRFHQAIEAVALPAANRVLERRKQRLGVASLRPWDLAVDPLGSQPLRPYSEVKQLTEGIAQIFQMVDPAFGQYFGIMRQENLLDLENRKNKGQGGFCIEYAATGRPFIFMNAVGVHDDVQTLLHEGGHAFHAFEAQQLPYFQQRKVGMEFSEVASMAMELLAAPYLSAPGQQFYDGKQAARARIDSLERCILFWPEMAVIDAFQHWAYTHPDAAVDASACDAYSYQLRRKYQPSVDWSGLETELQTAWQRLIHVFSDPFYFVEYGLAQLGAVQIWASARKDQGAAVQQYRRALALGFTRSVPQLYAAAGARFAFDAGTLAPAVDLLETVIAELESQA